MGTGPKATTIRWGEENKRYKRKYPQIKQNDRKEKVPIPAAMWATEVQLLSNCWTTERFYNLNTKI